MFSLSVYLSLMCLFLSLKPLFWNRNLNIQRSKGLFTRSYAHWEQTSSRDSTSWWATCPKFFLPLLPPWDGDRGWKHMGSWFWGCTVSLYKRESWKPWVLEGNALSSGIQPIILNRSKTKWSQFPGKPWWSRGCIFCDGKWALHMQIEWILKWYLMTIFVVDVNINCMEMKMLH